MEALGKDRWGRRQDNSNGQPGNRGAENHEAGWGVDDAGDTAWGTLGAGAGVSSGAGATAAEGSAAGAWDCGAALGAAVASGSWGVRAWPRSSETGAAAGEGAAAEDDGGDVIAGRGDLRAAGAGLVNKLDSSALAAGWTLPVVDRSGGSSLRGSICTMAGATRPKPGGS